MAKSSKLKERVLHQVVGTVTPVNVVTDKVLCIQRTDTERVNPGLWEFPGGGLDTNKNVTDALRVEVRQELGHSFSRHLVDGTLSLVEDRVYKRSKGDSRPPLHVNRYIGAVEEHYVPVAIPEPELTYHDAFCWMGKDDLSKYKFVPGVKCFMRKLFERGGRRDLFFDIFPLHEMKVDITIINEGNQVLLNHLNPSACTYTLGSESGWKETVREHVQQFLPPRTSRKYKFPFGKIAASFYSTSASSQANAAVLHVVVRCAENVLTPLPDEYTWWPLETHDTFVNMFSRTDITDQQRREVVRNRARVRDVLKKTSPAALDDLMTLKLS